MIDKIILIPDDELPPAIVEWSDEVEDYLVSVPQNIKLTDLISMLVELARITEREIE